MRLLDNNKKVNQAVYSRPYTLRAELSKVDGTYNFRVKSCFAFDKQNLSVPLIDDRGCPANPEVIDNFKYDEKGGWAEAKLYSMFRFPESSEVHFQVSMKLIFLVYYFLSCFYLDTL